LVLKGLCRICFRSGVPLLILKGDVMCSECMEKNNAKN